MKNIKYCYFLITAILTSCFTIGCSKSSYNIAKLNDPNRINSNRLVANRNISDSKIEEYVSRIGKRVLIVSSNPESHFQFQVENSSDVYLNTNNNNITITRGLLSKLKDEAELAVVLAYGISKASNSYYPDNKIMTYVSRAGYDPKAVVDLQEQYMNGYSPWLSSVFSENHNSLASLESNKLYLKRLPKGLQRGTDRYRKYI